MHPREQLSVRRAAVEQRMIADVGQFRRGYRRRICASQWWFVVALVRLQRTGEIGSDMSENVGGI